MAALSILPPYPVFTNTDGTALDAGYVYIGTAGLNAQTNPISVYWDAALTIPAAQPIRTTGGYPSRNGSPAMVYANSDYSIIVRNKRGSLLYSSLNATPRWSSVVVSDVSSANVSFLQSGTGAVGRSVQTKLREIVSVTDFDADPTGVADSTLAIQAALNTGQAVFFPQGYYKANNLTQSTNFQRIFATGDVRVIKNANGPLLTCSGLDVEISGIAFRGDAVSPTYTGDGLVMTGNNPRLINCGSRWMSGRAVKCTGQHVQIRGTCDLYQTSDATATGYDIEIGVSGTATLYHHISNIYTSQATGGILTTDCGSLVVEASQFGKLTVAAGTTPAGCNGGNYIGNRINGAVSVNISNSLFAGCLVSNVAMTFAAGTSGHSFGDSNNIAVGGTITDLSSNSLITDLRVVPVANYTPTWTAASVNPSLGNGTIFGTVAKWGKRVDVTIELNIGSTTTLGTGSWYFSMPYAAATNIQYTGSALAVCAGLFYVGTVLTMQDGTARLVVVGNAAGNFFDSGRPGAWVNTNYLKLTVSYYTA